MTDMKKCERADELVSYIYNEATKDARRSFEQHLTACVACRDELAAFGEVRGAVREWHEEIMQGAPALALDAVAPQFARNGRPVNTPVSTVAPVVAPVVAEPRKMPPSPAPAPLVMTGVGSELIVAFTVLRGNADGATWFEGGTAIAVCTPLGLTTPRKRSR